MEPMYMVPSTYNHELSFETNHRQGFYTGVILYFNFGGFFLYGSGEKTRQENRQVIHIRGKPSIICLFGCYLDIL